MPQSDYSNNTSKYLSKALADLFRLKMVGTTDEFQNYDRSGSRNIAAPGFVVVNNLKDFVADQRQRIDPVFRIEKLRQQAMEVLNKHLPEDQIAKEQMMKANAENVAQYIDELFSMIEPNGQLDRNFRTMKAKAETKPEDLTKYKDATYNAVTALFSIAAFSKSANPAEIMERLKKCTVNPISTLENNDERNQFTMTIAQNIRAIAEVRLDNKVSIAAIDSLKGIKGATDSTRSLFSRIKAQYREDKNWTAMTASIMQEVTTNQGTVEVCNYALATLSDYELFSKETFGNAVMYMVTLDQLGVVDENKLWDAMRTYYSIGVNAWNRFYDTNIANAEPGNDAAAEKTKEYYDHGVPQLNLGIIAMFQFIGKHDAKKDEVLAFIKMAANRDTFITYIQLLCTINGKANLDTIIENFNAAKTYQEKEKMLCAMFDALIYEPDKIDDNYGKIADTIAHDVEEINLSKVFAKRLIKSIQQRLPDIEQGDDVKKLYSTVVLGLAKKSFLISIFIGSTAAEYAKSNKTEWGPRKINTFMWNALVAIMGDKDIESENVDKVSFHEMLVLKLVNEGAMQDFIKTLEPITTTANQGNNKIKANKFMNASQILDKDVREQFIKYIKNPDNASSFINILFTIKPTIPIHIALSIHCHWLDIILKESYNSENYDFIKKQVLEKFQNLLDTLKEEKKDDNAENYGYINALNFFETWYLGDVKAKEPKFRWYPW